MEFYSVSSRAAAASTETRAMKCLSEVLSDLCRDGFDVTRAEPLEDTARLPSFDDSFG